MRDNPLGALAAYKCIITSDMEISPIWKYTDIPIIDILGSILADTDILSCFK